MHPVDCNEIFYDQLCLDKGCVWEVDTHLCHPAVIAEVVADVPNDTMIPQLVVVLVTIVLALVWKYSARWSPSTQSSSAPSNAIQEVIPWSNVFTMYLNGQKISLVNPDPEELLVTFIRDKMELKGTKLGCEEGGCGACTVTVTTNMSGVTKVMSVNSCLRPLLLNDGCCVTTVEEIGSVSDGLSEEQQAIVCNNGTQCGFCTPGWVSNMYALNQSNLITGASSSNEDVEKYLDGNICRCTGYKPILKAFKTTTDAEGKSECATAAKAGIECCKDYSKCGTSACKGFTGGSGVMDVGNIEDLHGTGSDTGTPAGRVRRLGRFKKDQELLNSHSLQPLHFNNPVSGSHWYRPVTMGQLCRVLEQYSNSSGAVQLVGGNTAIGVTKYLNTSAPYYSPDKYTVHVDINAITAFHEIVFNSIAGKLTVGAGVSINQLISSLQQYQRPGPKTAEGVNHSSIFSVTANHLHRIAGTQVRNTATWAGNLMTFLKYTSFPSDALLALTTAGVTLHCCDRNGTFSNVSIDEFIDSNYQSFVQERGMFIVSLTITEAPTHPVVAGGGINSSSNFLPPNQEVVAVTYKIAQRSTMSHAHVNAGFQFLVERRTSSTASVAPLCISARIVVGGVSQKLFLATTTAGFLEGKELTNATLQQAFGYLQRDLETLGGGINATNAEIVSPSYLYSLMQGCLYRSFLQCYRPGDLPVAIRSAILPWVKPESRGTELFVPSSATEFSNETPVGMPVHKIEAKIQTTGEAAYVSDIPCSGQACFGAFVYSTQCAVTLNFIDVVGASSLTGVVAVYTAADIPGENTIGGDSPLFVSLGSEVTCVGMPLALVVATSEAAANDAAGKVRVTYGSMGKAAITNLDEAVAASSFYKMPPVPGLTTIEKGDATQALSTAYGRSQGHISASGQNHMYMETQTAVATVTDGDCVSISSGTQDPTMMQGAVAGIIAYPQNKIEVKCPRVGGAFGGKITHGIPAAAAAALSATKLKRTVRIFNTRTADMMMSGGREGFSFDYDVGYTADGVVTALSYVIYVDVGNDKSDSVGAVYMAMNWADNAYYFPNYSAKATFAFTNTPSRTSMRAPGVVQSCFATEMVIERVAYELNLPVTLVQQRNFIRDGQTTIVGQPIVDCTLPTVWGTLMQRSNYDSRLANVEMFNSTNLWRKRGISAVPVKYGIGWGGYNQGIRIGIRQADGTVTIAHSGCEIGQGINTKVVQVVANQLGVDISMVKCQSTSTNKIVNGATTGGSGTSEVVCKAALNACDELNARLAPYRGIQQQQPSQRATTVYAAGSRGHNSHARVSVTKLGPDDWVKLLQSLPSDVSLNASGWYSPTENPNGQEFQYFVYGAAVSEIELNVLTGEVHTLSSEISYDCGVSLNPAVDIGQIEGAFVMGLGYFLQEKVEYSSTGGLKSIGTWEYKPPNAQDVPSVFNVTLLKNMYNTAGIMGSKATGEPPYVLANSIFFATKKAIDSARSDSHSSNLNSASRWGGSSVKGPLPYLQLAAPLTIDQRQQACMADVTMNSNINTFGQQNKINPNIKKFVLPC